MKTFFTFNTYTRTQDGNFKLDNTIEVNQFKISHVACSLTSKDYLNLYIGEFNTFYYTIHKDDWLMFKEVSGNI